MKVNRLKAELADNKIEFEENKIVDFVRKFWHFSKFYGKYLGSMHSNSSKQPKIKGKKDR